MRITYNVERIKVGECNSELTVIRNTNPVLPRTEFVYA